MTWKFFSPERGGVSPWGKESHMKAAGMLVVSLRGVNFALWSHLGCSGQYAIILSRKGLCECCTQRNIKKLNIYNSSYFLDSCNQSLKWSLLGVQKRLRHAQIGLLYGFSAKFPTSILSYGNPPPPLPAAEALTLVLREG